MPTRKHQLLTDDDRALCRKVQDHASRARLWVTHNTELCPDPLGQCSRCKPGTARRIWHELNNDADTLARQCPEVDNDGRYRRAPVAWTLAMATEAMRRLSEVYEMMTGDHLGASVLLAAVFGTDPETFGPTTTTTTQGA